jgi:hypothetical protein
VLTRCGHLFCWECLNVWAVQRGHRTVPCPNCEGAVDVDKDATPIPDVGDQDPPLDEVGAIQGAVLRLLQLLEYPDHETRLSAAMRVANLARGGSRITDILLKHDGDVKCLQLLAPNQPESIRELMACAVANLVESGRVALDTRLTTLTAADAAPTPGATPPLLSGVVSVIRVCFHAAAQFFGVLPIAPAAGVSRKQTDSLMGLLVEAIMASKSNSLPTLCNLARALGFLVPDMPPPPFEAVAAVLHHLLQHSDTAVQDAACWAVSDICDGPEERVVACQNAGLIPIVLELLRTQRPGVMLPAIRILGDCARISADSAQAILEMGVLQLMTPLVQPHVDGLIRQECCWTLCNVAAARPQVQAVLDSGLMPFVIRWMSEPDLELQKHAARVVANISVVGTPEQCRAAVEHFNCIPGLCAALRTGDVKVCGVALEACEAILALGDSLRTADSTTETDSADGRSVNPYVARFEEHIIVGMLPDLANSHDDAVSRRANQLREYFDTGNVSADSDATGNASTGWFASAGPRR